MTPLINYATCKTILTNNNYRNNKTQVYTTNGHAANTRFLGRYKP